MRISENGPLGKRTAASSRSVRLQNARSVTWTMLEGENGPGFRAEVAPVPRGDATKKRQYPSRSRHGVGLEERLFKAESHPVIKLVVQGTNVHGTLIARARGARSQHPADIASLGRVLAISEIDRPAGIATGRVSVKYAREWQTEADETALAAHWTLRSEDRNSVPIDAEDDVGRSVDRGYGSSSGKSEGVVEVRAKTAAEVEWKVPSVVGL